MTTTTWETKQAARYVRARHLDRRIAYEDSYDADAWIDRVTRAVEFVAPAHDPNHCAPRDHKDHKPCHLLAPAN